jgi:hypothetical protein
LKENDDDLWFLEIVVPLNEGDASDSLIRLLNACHVADFELDNNFYIVEWLSGIQCKFIAPTKAKHCLMEQRVYEYGMFVNEFGVLKDKKLNKIWIVEKTVVFFFFFFF